MNAKITQGEESEVKEVVDADALSPYPAIVTATTASAERGDYRPLKNMLSPRSVQLRGLMGEFGWTAATVGTLVHRSSDMVSKWACGMREPPAIAMELLEYKADEIRRKSALK